MKRRVVLFVLALCLVAGCGNRNETVTDNEDSSMASADKDIDPLADATFYLMDDEKVIYKMPSVYENDIRECEIVNGIVTNKQGESKDKEFRSGAEKCLQKAITEKSFGL